MVASHHTNAPAVFVTGVSYNRFGTDGSGNGHDAAERNVISGNGRAGIELQSSSYNVVAGNYIGLDINGSNLNHLGNGWDHATGNGVYINNATGNDIGGSNPDEANVISDNIGDGIFVSSDGFTSTGNNIVGNYIGTNPTGDAVMGNTSNGIALVLSTSNTRVR